MSLELAIRLSEVMLALAFIQQSFEHVKERYLFLPRIVLSILLLLGFHTPWVCMALVIHALLVLHRFQGPYNGGSDRMGLLILCCVTLAQIPSLSEAVLVYLALQAVLSYFMAGWVKVINPDWRSGQALQDVFRFSVYPVSESLRGWADYPKLLRGMSWGVMLLELLFPLMLLSKTALIIGLVLAATFHFANACLFGLNRFFWIWLAAYPSILWLQERIF